MKVPVFAFHLFDYTIKRRGGIYIQILSLHALSFVTHKLSIKRVCYLVYLSRMTKVPRTLGI